MLTEGCVCSLFLQEGACHAYDSTFVWVGQAGGDAIDAYPFHHFCFVIWIVFYGECAVEGFEEEVVDDFVDAAIVAGEPVVDGCEVAQDAAVYAGFFGYFAYGGLFCGFGSFEVAFGEAPFEASATVSTGDDGDVGVAVTH